MNARARESIYVFGMSFLAAVSTAADVGTPEWIVETFFTQETVPDAKEHYSGEMQHYVATPPMGHYAAPGYTLTKRTLESADDSVVWAVCYDYPEPEVDRDWYAFLVRTDGQWKLFAVRSLTLPGLHYETLRNLQEKPERSAQEQWSLEQGQMLTLSDASLKAFAQEHMAEFKAIADALAQQPRGTAIHGDEPGDESQRQLWTIIHTLHLNGAEHDRQGWIDLNLGGIVDNGVGFLFVPTGISPPRMDPETYILVDPIGDGWYLYKTT